MESLEHLPYVTWLRDNALSVPNELDAAYGLAVRSIKLKHRWQFSGPHIGHYLSPGWFLLLARAFEFADSLEKSGEINRQDFVWLQSKEKFGEIRAYNNGPDALQNFVTTLGEESLRTCEICGAPGATSSASFSSYLLTLCEQHHSERESQGRYWTPWPKFDG